MHAVVARSTFASQNGQSTRGADHLWKLRCRTSARRGGAKHISKSKRTKHKLRTTFGSCDVEKVYAVVARSTFPSQNVQNTSSGPRLEVAMSKKCTPLWREAHFQVKMYKTPHVRATFGGSDVEKVHAVVARSTFPSQNVKSTRGSDHFWRFRCASFRLAELQYIALDYTTLHDTTLHNTTTTTTQLHSTTLHYTK